MSRSLKLMNDLAQMVRDDILDIEELTSKARLSLMDAVDRYKEAHDCSMVPTDVLTKIFEAQDAIDDILNKMQAMGLRHDE